MIKGGKLSEAQIKSKDFVEATAVRNSQIGKVKRAEPASKTVSINRAVPKKI